MACAACSSTTRCSKSKSTSRRATFLKFHHVTMQKGLRGLALLKFVCSVRAPGTSMDQCTGKDAGSERPRLHSIRKEKLQALHTKLQPCMGIRNFFEQKHVRFLKKPCTQVGKFACLAGAGHAYAAPQEHAILTSQTNCPFIQKGPALAA